MSGNAALCCAPRPQIQRMTALSTVLDAKLLAFLLDVNSPMAFAEQHIRKRIGNAQHYEWELFVRSLTASAWRATERFCSARLRAGSQVRMTRQPRLAPSLTRTAGIEAPGTQPWSIRDLDGREDFHEGQQPPTAQLADPVAQGRSGRVSSGPR
jgi:hypothetical protein